MNAPLGARAVFAGLTAPAGLAAALALSACLPLLAGGSSSTETGDKVALSGVVSGGNGEGVPGVVVALVGSSLADTTDITGAYALSGRRTRPAGSGADTLRFVLNGQTVVKTPVNTLVGALPAVTIVQRGFSGSFSRAQESVGRVEGVLTGDGIGPGDSVVAAFYHNALAGNYSGFIWFPSPGSEIRRHVVHVNVYDGSGKLTGRSQSVPFNSLAGNITIPEFAPQNLLSPEAAPAPRRMSTPSPETPPGARHDSP